MGTLKEVMNEMSQETYKSNEDPSTPHGSEDPHYPMNNKEPTNFSEVNEEPNNNPGEVNEEPDKHEDELSEKSDDTGQNDRDSDDDLLTEVENALKETDEKCHVFRPDNCVHQGNRQPSGWIKNINFCHAKNCDRNSRFYYRWKRSIK